MKKILVIILSLMFLGGCNDNGTTERSNVIYTTIYPIEYILDYLLEDKVEVVSLIPLGNDAHTYEPTQKQILEVAEADMYFYLGLGLEEVAKSINNVLKNENVQIVEVGEYVFGVHDEDNDDEGNDDHDHDDHDDHDHDEDHDHSNHHIWVDPLYMIDMASVVKEKLVEMYPELESQIKTNYSSLINEMIVLDDLYEDTLKGVDIKVFVVTHDAFRHWDKYNITSIAVKDEAHSKDPTQQEMDNIIETIKQEEIKYIAYEQNIPCLPADIIKMETGTGKVTLHNLSVRTQIDIDENRDYVDLMKINLDLLSLIMNK